MLSVGAVYYLAPKLQALLSGEIFTVSYKIKEYNKIYEKLQNVNVLLSYAHDALWKQLKKKLEERGEPFPQKSVIDQFCDKQRYYEHLDSIGILGEELTNFETKTEMRHLSCAIASIISRFNFLEEIAELSRKFRYKIPLGCSKVVMEAFQELKTKRGFKPEEVCKMHFKTLEKAKLL